MDSGILLEGKLAPSFLLVSSCVTTMYLIHLINADKSSQWRAFWHGPSDLNAYRDQTKWMIAKSLLYFVPKRIIWEKLPRRLTFYKENHGILQHLVKTLYRHTLQENILGSLLIFHVQVTIQDWKTDHPFFPMITGVYMFWD